MPRTSLRAHQHELAFRRWGGARRGAGRKSTGPRSRVAHDARPRHLAGDPVHVTARLCEGLPSLRDRDARHAIAGAFAGARERFGFRLVHFSLQSNHLHLITEAKDRSALSRGMQGLLVRIARALNTLWQRSGSVFADRFHARALGTPREVRTALVYVFQNARRHGVQLLGIDPFSSGAWFDGWKPKLARKMNLPPIVVAAKTWLLREGWLRHGRIGFEESPATPHGGSKPSDRFRAGFADLPFLVEDHGRAAHGERPMASGPRRSAHGDRPTAIGPRRSAHGDRPMAIGPWRSAHGDRPMASGPRRVAHGEWPTASGPRRVAHAERPSRLHLEDDPTDRRRDRVAREPRIPREEPLSPTCSTPRSPIAGRASLR